MGCGLMYGFIDHLYTPLGTTRNYSAIADFHTLQIITATIKPFSSLLCLHQPFPGNSGYSSASRGHIITVWQISCN
jgi:hypothetical protein